jgi:hypothetical protein
MDICLNRKKIKTKINLGYRFSIKYGRRDLEPVIIKVRNSKNKVVKSGYSD